jgi:hypothetical protein
MVLGGFVPSSVNAYFFLHILVFYKYFQIWWFVISEMTGESNSLEFGNPERPECNNLLSIYELASGKTKEVKNGLYFSYIYNCLSRQYLVQPSMFDSFHVKILFYGFTFCVCNVLKCAFGILRVKLRAYLKGQEVNKLHMPFLLILFITPSNYLTNPNYFIPLDYRKRCASRIYCLFYNP